jgi:hypothetical protein
LSPRTWAQSVWGLVVNDVTGTSCKRCLQYVPLLKWWAHQDLNLGPKDYEQLKEIKPITNQ